MVSSLSSDKKQKTKKKKRIEIGKREPGQTVWKSNGLKAKTKTKSKNKRKKENRNDMLIMVYTSTHVAFNGICIFCTFYFILYFFIYLFFFFGSHIYFIQV